VGTGKNHTGEDHMDVREPSSAHPATDDEWANLTSEGFDLDEGDPKYGQDAILKAYRAGYLDGVDSWYGK
jgi:hypothetical protein